jgi:predicted nucleic acid-binding protein
VVDRLTLERFLKRHQRIGLDTNLLIYFIESHPEYHSLARTVLDAIEAGRNTGVCSTLSLLEVLIEPYRRDNEELVNQFYGLLTTYPGVTWVELSTEIADLAARIRAQHRLKTPDSIVLASAIHAGATGFVGNDIQMARVPDIEVLVLSR